MLPMKCPIGKVVDVYMGEDGLVRVVTVKTAAGIYCIDPL